MLIDKLFDLGCIKFGSFTLKSGIVSPFYIDLRLTVSSPSLLIEIADAICDAAGRGCDLVCGVPYTALPFATIFSIRQNVPMVLKRKEKKAYGTGKLCEGIFSPGQTCLLIEDVVTSGQSVLETAECLKAEGLAVADIAVLVDREQGGVQLLKSQGYRVHPVLTISQITTHLSNRGIIDEQTLSSLQTFLCR